MPIKIQTCITLRTLRHLGYDASGGSPAIDFCVYMAMICYACGSDAQLFRRNGELFEAEIFAGRIRNLDANCSPKFIQQLHC